MVCHFNSTIISNQIKYYLAINRVNFLQIKYGFYRYALQIHYQPWSFVIERASTKNSRKLMPGTWLIGALWWKAIKVLLLHEIDCFFEVCWSLGFFDRRNWNSECPGKWQGSMVFDLMIDVEVIARPRTMRQSHVISNH